MLICCMANRLGNKLILLRTILDKVYHMFKKMGRERSAKEFGKTSAFNYFMTEGKKLMIVLSFVQV